MMKKFILHSAAIFSISMLCCPASWANTGEDDIEGNFEIGGNLTVVGNSDAGGNSDVGGNNTVGGNSDIGGNSIVGGNSSIGGNASVGGNLTVGGRLTASSFQGGEISGTNLLFTDCNGRYQCTPKMCLELCIANGMRMATANEVYAWASQGKDHCEYMWMLNSAYIGKAYLAYPMYSNRTAPGCGTLNTGNIPRLEGSGVYNWDSGDRYNCACAGIM